MTGENTVVLRKIQELCQTILEQPEFESIRERVAAFLADDQARTQYDNVSAKGQALQYKQQQGTPLTETEIAEFEKDREALINNPVAQAFFDAQNEIQEVKNTVARYVSRTFELGRLPTEDDFSKCGSGCNCH